ncbi:DNA-processing protein DprA [Herbiconiux sp. VKM Ac-2851]|uniref:DNA-processing protein DprA n=1 Tax=Herbiconiux sp. VKM Ac-2851 TaxID=2739025 RepID=UPI0020B15BC2|nr:DNA-processing protein DprA [Herbiconiux sp. VKM Ac-2851]
MMLFGLDRSLVLALARAVMVPPPGPATPPPTASAPSVTGDEWQSPPPSPSDPSDDFSSEEASAARLFASAAWSGIAEPGDSVAGLVVAALGAERALTMLIDRSEPAQWFAALGAEVSDSDQARSHIEHDGVTVEVIAAALERWRPRVVSRVVVGSLRSAARFEARLLTPEHPLWPEGCRDLDLHAPHALWVRGNVGAVDHPGGGIAIVGSRDATNYGEYVAMELSAGVSDRGFSVVSGGAYGIDGMAHRAALVSGGTTVAFLAGGVDRLYPAAHHDLLLRIAARGALVSELPCGASPTKWRFLQRNRLIAAMTRATVVVEAGHRSGSLNTAGHAAALGRPLGAVPGPVTSATSAGCHRLLREYDATCVTTPADVVELVLGPATDRPSLLDPPPPPRSSASVARGLSGSVPPGSSGSAAPGSSGSVVPGSPGSVAPGSLGSVLPHPAGSPMRAGSVSDGVCPEVPGVTDSSAAGGDADTPAAEAPSSGAGAPVADDGAEVRVLDALTRRTRRTPSDVAARAGLSVRAVEAALGILLLEGRVEETETGWRRSRA